EDVVHLVRVNGHHGDDDLHLVAQALDEGRTQRAVDEAGGEDSVCTRATLATEEAARDAAGGVHALLDVNGQWEEVDPLARGTGGRRRGQQHRVLVQVRGDGPVRLSCQQAGLEAESAGTKVPVVDGCGCFPDPCIRVNHLNGDVLRKIV